MKEPVLYQAFLIRLWPTVRGGEAGHRVSLESVTTGERKDFLDLEDLLAFLHAQADEGEQVPESPRR